MITQLASATFAETEVIISTILGNHICHYRYLEH